MTRISYVNGQFLDHGKASVPIEDRGLQFADGVYEVVAFFNRRLLDFGPHMKRLKRSLSELSMSCPLAESDLKTVMERLVAENEVTEGIVYLQITRGVAPRDHAFPDPPVTPTVIATVAPLDMAAIAERHKNGVKIILVNENRWTRPDIKSTSLLGNVLAKEAAHQADAYEAVYVDREGNVTEGTSSNIWLIDENDILITRKTDGAILSGITRGSVMGLVSGVEERAFSRGELVAAKEVVITSTTSLVMPVVRVDDAVIGDGKPGPVTRGMQKAYWGYIGKETGYEGSS